MRITTESLAAQLSRRELIVGTAACGLTMAHGSPWARPPGRPSWRGAAHLASVLADAVEAGLIVGATAVVARDGAIVYQGSAGFADREARQAMKPDQLCRLASMTKPIVCVAALALIDQGRLGLHDPVTKWLPDFRPKLADGREAVISIWHLLTHTSGLGYAFLEALDGPYHQLGVSDGLDASGLSLQENLQRIARSPLLFEPGTAWHYSVATDVLGSVIERVTGRLLPDAVHDLVTGPLGMDTVRFVAPPEAALATAYADAHPVPVRMTEPFSLQFGKGRIDYSPARAFDAKAFPSGGVGMVGTARDYIRFAEAIRTGGSGVIMPQTAAAMTSNVVGNLSIAAAGPGFGWGLGVAVLNDPLAAKLPLNAGSWNWSGVYGTHFWVDPVEKLSAVILTNTAVAGMTGAFALATRQAAYKA